MYYTSVLAKLRKHTAMKRPKLHRAGWRLHHDNAQPHAMQFLAKFNITCVPHPPYSPDLAPCDFFLFPSLKAKRRGVRFETSEAVLKKSEAILKDLTKNGLHHVFEKWPRCKRHSCIQITGKNLYRILFCSHNYYTPPTASFHKHIYSQNKTTFNTCTINYYFYTARTKSRTN